MKTKKAWKFAVLAALVLTCWGGGSYGQYLDCNTLYVAPEDSLEVIPTSGYQGAPSYAQVRCFVHILRESDGSGGLTASEAENLVYGSFVDLISVGVHAVVVDQVDLNNSTYYADPDANAALIFLENPHADAIDIYLGPSVGSAKGRAENIPSSAMVITGVLDSPAALSHILGNCLGLYETSMPEFGVEDPNGSNGATTGDLVEDTAADPGLANSVESDCSLDALFLVTYPNHDPDPTNIMSNSRMSCWSEFTSGQRERVLAAIDLSSVLQAVSVLDVNNVYKNVTSDTKLTTITEYPPEPSNSVSFDFIGDGLKDILVSGFMDSEVNQNPGFAGKCSFLTDEKVPEFQDKSVLVFGLTNRPPDGTTGFVAADYDNDGNIDFYAPNPNWNTNGGAAGHPHRLYRNNGNDTFTQLGSGYGFPTGTDTNASTLSGAWGDYNGDGYLDLLLGVYSDQANHGSEYGVQSLCLLENTSNPGAPGGRGFEDVTVSSGLIPVDENNLHVNSTLWIDLDQDYDMDLVTIQWNQVAGEYSKYYLNTDGHFTNVSSTHFANRDVLTTGHTFASHGDIDNDGDIDIVYHNSQSRGWYRNAFDGTSGSATLAMGWNYSRSPNEWGNGWPALPRDVDVFDYDLDGNLDYAIANDGIGISQPGLFRHSSSDNSFQFVTDYGVASTATHSLGAADYALDGYTELHIATNDDNGRVPFFYKSQIAYDQAGTNNWVGIRLEASTASMPCNFRGIGATVIVTAGGTRRAQVVDGGSGGQGGQHDLDLSFGLGAFSDSVDVEIIWPCAQTQYVKLPINQYNTVVLDGPFIDSSTVNAYRIWTVGPLENDWVFEWHTSSPGHNEMDRVLFPNGIPGYPSFSVLDINTPNTTWEISPLPGGNYRHVVIWQNDYCDPISKLRYQVSSAVAGYVAESSLRFFSPLSCIVSE